MTRLPVFAILIATGVPLVGVHRWPVAAVAIGATVLLLTGLKRASLGVTIIGGVLAISELALALTSTRPALVLLRPVAVGLALLYVVEEVEYAGRVARAHVDSAAQKTRNQALMQQTVAAVTTTVLLAMLASGIAAYLPLHGAARIVVAGIGAVVALLAAWIGASGFRLKKTLTGKPDTT
ncbi:hypothetical protein [Paraburkholderia sp.]|uniref:hypothetical protein n=1 Tax=Paraburkholderia sp. TaxID=1926495 RepID=UPI0039E33538